MAEDTLRDLYNLGMQVRDHFHTGLPHTHYNPLFDPEVVEFITRAVMAEIEFEDQQAKQLDALDKEVG